MLRAAVSGVFLIAVLSTSFSSLGQLPATLLRPIGILQVLSWKFYDLLLTADGMSMLKWAIVISLVCSTIGYLTKWTTKASALLVLFYEGLVRSFGHFNHDEMLGVYCLIVLAFSPCGDGFAVDSLPGKRTSRGTLAYGYPILLMQMLLAWTYFSSALIKLRVAGLRYFSKDNLPTLAIIHSLDNLHDTEFRLAFSLPAIWDYLPIVVILVFFWELLFPLAVFWKRSRWWFLSAGVVFHLATMLVMNVFFPFQLAMYAVFIDWPKLAKWATHLPILRRLASWWRLFRSVPENFPSLRVKGLSSGGVLLWDGDCGFCAVTLRMVKRLARSQFLATPYQSVSDKLPEEVRRWSPRQAHWIDAEGKVTGGSEALIDLLESTGRPFLATLLQSPVLRPILWLGYRIVAANRGRLAKAVLKGTT